MEIIEENFSFTKVYIQFVAMMLRVIWLHLLNFMKKMTEEREESFRQYCEPLELTVRLQTSMTIYPKSNL